ncbi:MAG: hypothetical protein KJ737_06385 [Proteobacteria bacterium]|nr:hypothetical protein [Pseudomonadota bacterium]
MSSDTNREIDYYGFKGAGGPGDPPVPNPKSNPDRARNRQLWLSFLLSIPPIIIAFLVFEGWAYWRLIIAGTVAGISIAVCDWMYEVYAYTRGYWFVYGGHTRIGKINLFHVPLEMSIGFVPLGIALVILSYLPLLVRHLGIAIWPFSHPSLDNVLCLPVIILIVSFGGGYFDFISKKYGLFMNGHNWDYFIHCMSVWVPLSSLAVIFSRIILLNHDLKIFCATITLIIVLHISGVIIFHRFYI